MEQKYRMLLTDLKMRRTEVIRSRTQRRPAVLRGRAGRLILAPALLAVLLAMPLRVSGKEESSGLPPAINGLTFEKQTDFLYADQADIYYYEGGYKLLDVHESARYLVVPKDGEVPEGLDGDVTVIHEPLQKVYMAATAAMALVNAAGGLEQVGFSSLTADNWYVDDAAAAMNEGKILFAGKYSEPDFELLLAEGCDLAVESTMILHSPKVQEMIEKLGIPVFIDRSSYEEHPLGRTEWVRVYGALLGHEEEAESFFAEQSAVMSDLEDFENTAKTVAFFSLHSNGSVVVRRVDDYVPRMIELAGGVYALEDVQVLQDSARSSVNLTMEEFYAAAVDADYLVYNGTIQVPIHSIDELLDKNSLFAEFKAVKEGNVWCADKYLYQATDIVGQLIRDFHHMLTDGDEEKMTFIYKVK